MHRHTDNKQPHSTADAVSQGQNANKVTTQLTDNRLAARSQSKLQNIADTSPHTLQVKTAQLMADQTSVIQQKLSRKAVTRITQILAFSPDEIPLASAARNVWKYLGSSEGTDEHVSQVLSAMGYAQLDKVPKILEQVRAQLDKQDEVKSDVESDEERAAKITTVNDTGGEIGPFNGGRGSRNDVPPSKGAVYYDSSRKYCISPDNSGHAGEETWKLFSYNKGKWSRVDTLDANGARMYRG